MPGAASTSAPLFPAPSIDRIAHAAPDREAACNSDRTVCGLEVTQPMDVPAQGIRIVMMTPISGEIPVAAFLDRMPKAGRHHLCLTVADADAGREYRMRVLGKGAPQPGHHDSPLFFLHPGDCHGVLTEIEAHDTQDERTHDHG